MNKQFPEPTSIKLHKQSKTLEIEFADEATFILSCEYLRVYSPSAEVRGHSPSQRVWVLDKADVNINEITPVGHYAVKLSFDDGHDTGLYSWEYLYELGQHHAVYWQDYLLQSSKMQP